MPQLSKKPVAKQIILPNSIYLNNEDRDKQFIEKACIKLLDGTYGSDFEKLSHTNLYSMRLEQKGRIILAKLIIKGISTLVLVESMFDHKYDRAKSLLLTAAQLSHHINKCAEGAVYVLNELGRALSTQEEASTSPQRLIEYGGQYIEASEAQYGMLQTTENDKTEVICGEAGSGKTLILMHRIATLAHALATDEASTRKIWVIVPHAPLQEHLELEWQNQLIYRDIEAQRQTNPTLQNPVHIVTPDIFYRRLDAIASTVQSKDHRDFLMWLPPEDLTIIQRAFGRASSMQVYQELCLFNGLIILQGNQQEAEKAYCSPELTQALLESANKQQAARDLTKLLSKYHAHLTNNNGFDAYLYQPKNKLPEHDYFFEDEAQNLPPGLLKVPNALIAMNDSQSIRFRRRANEILLAYVNKGSITYCTLPGTHRCPKQPIELASRVDAFTTQHVNPKRKLASTSAPLRAMHPEEGFVCFVDSTDDEVAVLRQAVQEPDTAVVYLTHEAEEQFKRLDITPLIPFTPDNPILGLEFKRVIIASPFNASFAHDIRGELTNNQIATLELYLNTLKAAMTRATDTLVVFQPKTHETTFLVDYFRSEAPWTTSTLQTMTMTHEERAALFYEQAKNLYREGQREMALSILRHSQQDINAFLREVSPSCQPQPLSIPVLKEATAALANDKPATSSSVEKAAESALSAKPTPTAAIAVAQDTTTPLSESLGQYVEQFYQNVTEKNLVGLLKHRRATAMLFHHKMINGNCLFINLLFANKLSVLSTLLQKKETQEAKAFDTAVSTIKEEDYFLRLSLSSLKSNNAHNKKLTLEDIRRIGIGELFTDAISGEQQQKIAFLLQLPTINQLTPQELAHQVRRTDGILAPSFLHILALNSEQWTHFLNNKSTEQKKALLRAHFANHSTEADSDEDSVLLTLVQTPKGEKWVSDHMKIITPLITPSLLFETAYAKAVPNILYWLFITSTPGKCNWDIIKICLDKDRLFTPIVNHDSWKEITPFFSISSKRELIAMLSEHWEEFKPHLSEERLFAPMIIKGQYEGANLFYTLCSSPASINLVRAHWDDFKPYLTAERLLTTVTEEVHYKGITTFFFLCTLPEGINLLNEHWEFFKQFLSTEQLFAHGLGLGPLRGASPCYALASSAEGITFLEAHWDDFKKYIGTGESELEGITPFFGLCSIPCGIALLNAHWDDFKQHLGKQLCTPVTIACPFTGETAFTSLCSSAEGCSLIIEHWDDLKVHLCNTQLSEKTTQLLNSSVHGKLVLILLAPIQSSPAKNLNNHGLFASAAKDKSEDDMKNTIEGHSMPAA